MKTCVVLQIKKDAPDRRFKTFVAYDAVKKVFGKVDINDYESVWAGLVDDDSDVEDIYQMCNLNHPDGYRGHSLSVSDIVMMDGKLMYCDSIGFTEVEL